MFNVMRLVDKTIQNYTKEYKTTQNLGEIMASNILIKRVCSHCGIDFIAKTTVTKFCSSKCNSKFYKAALKAKKIDKSHIETVVEKANARIKALDKDFLSVTETAALLCCSRAAVYKMITLGRLKSARYLGNVTRIHKTEILGKFDEQYIPQPINEPKKSKAVPKDTNGPLTVQDCYRMDELVSLFQKMGISAKVYARFAFMLTPFFAPK